MHRYPYNYLYSHHSFDELKKLTMQFVGKANEA